MSRPHGIPCPVRTEVQIQTKQDLLSATIGKVSRVPGKAFGSSPEPNAYEPS